MAGWTTVVQPDILSMALGRADLVLVDCRFSLIDPTQGELAWRSSHLPGAVYAHLERDLSDMTRKGQGRHPWPSLSAFLGKLSHWGIEPGMQVVAYDDADGSRAARMWFLLRMLGHEKTAVLDGGWKRWMSLGLPTSSHPVTRITSTYRGEFDLQRLCDSDAVQTHLDKGGLLLDARAPERFRGEEEPLDRVAGHVPGAINRPFMQNLGSDGRFKSPAQLADEYRELLNGREPAATIAMCGSGVTACHNLLAMERAGLKGARLYPASWSGWITDPAHPVATGD